MFNNNCSVITIYNKNEPEILLEIDIPLIICCDNSIHYELYEKRKSLGYENNTHFIIENKFDELTIIEKSITENPFKSSKFLWLHANINHICHNFKQYKLLSAINHVKQNKLHIQIIGYNEINRKIIGGGIGIMLRVIKFIKMLNLNYNDILTHFYDDIEKYYGNSYDALNNFIVCKKNYEFIVDNIMKKYYIKREIKQCKDISKYILNSLHKYLIPYSDDLYLRLLDYCK